MSGPDRLAVFDIDGTLTRTNRIDNVTFRAAHAAVLGEVNIDHAWGDFTHMTDRCINAEIFQRIAGRPPSETEIEEIQTDFVDRLRRAHAEDAAAFEAVAGAATVLAHLKEEAGWAVALATGGWGVSARFKLDVAGIEHARLPGAFGHEFVSREEIVGTAIARAAEAHGVASFKRVVSVGDGVWDVLTARNMALPFVGVADKDKAKDLKGAGAARVLSDYGDPAAVVEILDTAEVPR